MRQYPFPGPDPALTEYIDRRDRVVRLIGYPEFVRRQLALCHSRWHPGITPAGIGAFLNRIDRELVDSVIPPGK